MSLGDFIPTTYTLGSWHSVPHLLTIYPDIRNLLNPGSLPQEFLILLFTWVETYRNSDSTDSFLLTVPPSLSYFPLHATAIQSPGRTHCSLFSEGEKKGILVNLVSQYLQNLTISFWPHQHISRLLMSLLHDYSWSPASFLSPIHLKYYF